MTGKLGPLKIGTFDQMLYKIRGIPECHRETRENTYRVWYGDLEGVAKHGPDDAVCYCVTYLQANARPIKVQLVGTETTWTRSLNTS
jgi:hypothetical protein